MAKNTQRSDQTANPNTPIVDDTVHDGDDHDAGDAEGAPPVRDRVLERDPERDPMEALFLRVKAKLGLPADASPVDLLHHLAGGSVDVSPSGPPVALCRTVAVVDGKRVVINAGDPIPEGVDLATLPKHSVGRGR